MGKKKFAKDPLLYIHQPTIQKPEAPMQHNYATPKKSVNHPPPTPQENIQKKSRTGKRSYFEKKEADHMRNEHTETELETDDHNKETKAPVGESEPAVESTEKNEQRTSHKQNRTKFKDMTLEERIHYFIELPKHLPMKCEVKTEEKSYRGFIEDFKENTVFMRMARKNANTEVPFEEITSIRMLGF